MSAIYKDGTLYPTGGSGSSGHTILDNTGTSLTDEPNLKFGGDFEVSDDSENELTEVKPHRFTSEEMSEIISPLPAAQRVMPILYDETGAEYVVGWYKRSSDGKKKPVYEKAVVLPAMNWGDTKSVAHNISDLDIKLKCEGYIFDTAGSLMPLNFIQDTNTAFAIKLVFTSNYVSVYARTTASSTSAVTQGGHVILQYTKTSDSWQ